MPDTTTRTHLPGHSLRQEGGGPPAIPPNAKIVIQGMSAPLSKGLGCLGFLGLLFLLFSGFIGLLIFLSIVL